MTNNHNIIEQHRFRLSTIVERTLSVNSIEFFYMQKYMATARYSPDVMSPPFVSLSKRKFPVQQI